MNKLIHDSSVTELLLFDLPAISVADPLTPKDCEALISALTRTIDHTTTALLDNPPGHMRNAMGVNIRVLSRLINALCDYTKASHRDQGVAR
ncbi:hypothetical protein I5S53_18990 [Pseudomonas juntendi]|uniref:hypothetical protein n=1 Tax=Pseudomonas TaxID=286 RepID=UPI000D978DDE|nr:MULTISPECIES: hypothetical protein [Pseudomonas]MBH3386032.1 hypothetical protein [Pseudomonas juntendi]PYC03492.1 hypothetical protein DMX12_10425 [Pseudomonas sp. MB-090624]